MRTTSRVISTTSALLVTAALLPSATADTGTPQLLGGEVISLRGGTVSVSAALWPNQAYLDALPDDGEVPLLYLDNIDVEGNAYTVSLEAADVPTDYRTATGAVDVEITAIDEAGNSDSYNETLTPAGDTWQRSDAAAGLLDDPTIAWAELPGNLALAANAEEATVAEQAGDVLAQGNDTLTTVEAALEPICSTNKTATTMTRNAKVSAVMPAVYNMTGRVTYKIGSSHSLGIAYKDYRTGAVSEGGTITRSSDESVTPVEQARDHIARTWWVFREYKNSCTQKAHARAETHDGGYSTESRSRPAFVHCRQYQPVQTWSRSTNQAHTYQSGVNLYGLEVNTQTGYSEQVTLQYMFPNASRWLCGNTATPPSAKLVAGYASDQG